MEPLTQALKYEESAVEVLAKMGGEGAVEPLILLPLVPSTLEKLPKLMCLNHPRKLLRRKKEI